MVWWEGLIEVFCAKLSNPVFSRHIFEIKRKIRFRAPDNLWHKVYLLPDFSKVFKSMLIFQYLSLCNTFISLFLLSVSVPVTVVISSKIDDTSLCVTKVPSACCFFPKAANTYFGSNLLSSLTCMVGTWTPGMNNFCFHLNTLDFLCAGWRNHLPDLIHIIE